MRLPLHRDDALPNVPSLRPAVRTGLPRHRVLVVDDVYASAKTLAMMLESINQEVAIAHDGPEALEQVASRRPDIVFMDIAMPGMNGYEVARTLREKAEI